ENGVYGREVQAPEQGHKKGADHGRSQAVAVGPGVLQAPQEVPHRLLGRARSGRAGRGYNPPCPPGPAGLPPPRLRRKILSGPSLAPPTVPRVDYAPLRSWLGLPPGPWPPDHYTLLGLPPGEADPAAVERRVLERMDLLRRHQLLHPE